MIFGHTVPEVRQDMKALWLSSPHTHTHFGQYSCCCPAPDCILQHSCTHAMSWCLYRSGHILHCERDNHSCPAALWLEHKERHTRNTHKKHQNQWSHPTFQRATLHVLSDLGLHDRHLSGWSLYIPHACLNQHSACFDRIVFNTTPHNQQWTLLLPRLD